MLDIASEKLAAGDHHRRRDRDVCTVDLTMAEQPHSTQLTSALDNQCVDWMSDEYGKEFPGTPFLVGPHSCKYFEPRHFTCVKRRGRSRFLENSFGALMALEIVNDDGSVDENRHQSLRVRREPERIVSTETAPVSLRSVQVSMAGRMTSRSNDWSNTSLPTRHG